MLDGGPYHVFRMNISDEHILFLSNEQEHWEPIRYLNGCFRGGGGFHNVFTVKKIILIALLKFETLKIPTETMCQDMSDRRRISNEKSVTLLCRFSGSFKMVSNFEK